MARVGRDHIAVGLGVLQGNGMCDQDRTPVIVDYPEQADQPGAPKGAIRLGPPREETVEQQSNPTLAAPSW